MQFKTFEEAEKFLYSIIPRDNKNRFTGTHGIEQTKYFLSLLGNPQEKLKIIHVAGTSGKGSTAYLISKLLAAHGKRTGLHLSPHLVDIRERFQINNELIDKKLFVKYLNEILFAFEKVRDSSLGEPNYFRFLVVLGFYIYSKELVEYAVIETGLGGLFDATNVVENPNKTDVLTKIGLDHMEILGDTVAKIAAQKAGIIHEGNLVLSIAQEKEAEVEIKKRAKEKSATLYFVQPQSISNLTLSEQNTQFTYSFGGQLVFANLNLSLIGSHQAQNASLALSTVILISQRNHFKLDEKIIRKTLENAHFPGRMDIFKKNNKTIIVDGAHNTQKMNAFLENLTQLFPDKKFHFLLAFKKGKDIKPMLQLISDLASKITITSFFLDNQDMVNVSEPAENIAAILDNVGFSNYEIQKDSKVALTNLLESKEKLSIITGSLYLLSEIYPALNP